MKKFVLLIVIPLLVSCEKKTNVLNGFDRLHFSDIVARGQDSDKNRRLPGDIYSDVMSLIKEVRSMPAVEFDALDEQRIFYLAKPLTELRFGSIKLPERVVELLKKPMQEYLFLLENKSLDTEKKKRLESDINELLQNHLEEIEFRGQFTSNEVIDLFKEWRSDTGFELTCTALFNSNDTGIFLIPRDNLQAAHTLCEETKLILLSEGSYYRQSVEIIREGTFWIGMGNTRLDGLNAVEAAFTSSMSQSYFGWLEIVNYTGYGITSTKDKGVSDITINRVWFNQIGREADGQKYGAVIFEWASNIRITSSKFKNVTSSIRFLNSNGPLLVANNEAVNTGRNFFQCDKCNGAGILIENNSMEQYGQSGTRKLEDFINIFKSYGTPTDYIRIRGNRARTDGTGNGVSPTGSFIILGDHGGGYQIAEENIGVNPGNVGIGAAGGNDIHVIGNVMYSDPIKEISNVAFYSYLEPPSPENFCSNHLSVNNRAYWYCFSDACGSKETAVLNKAYSPALETRPDYCGLTNEDINVDASVFEDPSVTHEIWNNF